LRYYNKHNRVDLKGIFPDDVTLAARTHSLRTRVTFLETSGETNGDLLRVEIVLPN